MSMTVEQYRKKHRRCRTCVFANPRWSYWDWCCEAKNIVHNGKPYHGKRKGMFCRLYQPKEGGSYDGQVER